MTREQKMHSVLKIGKIYRGQVIKVIDFGIFIKVDTAAIGSKRPVRRG